MTSPCRRRFGELGELPLDRSMITHVRRDFSGEREEGDRLPRHGGRGSNLCPDRDTERHSANGKRRASESAESLALQNRYGVGALIDRFDALT